MPKVELYSRLTLGPIHPRRHRILWVLSQGVKQQGLQANKSPLPSAEVKGAFKESFETIQKAQFRLVHRRALVIYWNTH